MFAKIEPINYRTGNAKCMVVRGISVHLGEKAIIDWSLMGENGVDSRDYESGAHVLSGSDYVVWGDDDSYIYTWLSSQLNVTIVALETGSYWDS